MKVPEQVVRHRVIASTVTAAALLLVVVLLGLYVTVAQLASLFRSGDPTAPDVIVYAADRFQRTVSGGWGSAGVGGAYTVTGNSAAEFGVSDSAGGISVAPGQSNRVDLPDASARDVDVTVRVAVSAVAAGGDAYATIVARRAEGEAGYQGRVRFTSTRTIGLQARVVDEGASTSLGTEVIVPGVTYAPDRYVWVHLQVVGANPTTIRMNAWADESAEPGSWLYSATDANHDLQEAGMLGLGGYLDPASTVKQLTFSFASYRVQSVGPPPNLVWKPFLSQMGPTGVIVQWATYSGANPTVRYSTDTSYSQSARGSNRVLSALKYQYHQVRLTGLRPSTTYHYKIYNDGTDQLPSATLSFRTAPPVGSAQAFTFAAFGDFGTNSVSQRRLRNQMLRDSLSFVMWTGDDAYEDGSLPEFNAEVFSVYRDLLDKVGLFPSLGNHDTVTDNGAPYLDVFALPAQAWKTRDQRKYYSFDWANAHFVVLDSNSSVDEANAPLDESPTDPTSMYAWLAYDLAHTSQPWKIVTFHHPAYSTGEPGSTPAVDSKLVPIFERYGVDLVLNGHAHYYMRTLPLEDGQVTTNSQGGVVYVVTGAGDHAGSSCTTARWVAYQICAPYGGLYTRVTINKNQITLEGVDDLVTIKVNVSWTKEISRTTATSGASIPIFSHIYLVVMENQGYSTT